MKMNDVDEEEDKVIGTSPCGRWEKRNKQFSLREFPCMVGASLAMDTEEGIEVVWIETRIRFETESEMEQIKTTLDMVVRYSHPNLVKFHDYWIEDRDQQKMVVFITESLTCGSVTQFIKKSKLNEKPIVLGTWRRWCRQILLGIEYLHTRIPPYVLYNLSSDDIFIQHNGLVKIALVHSLCAIEKMCESNNSQQQPCNITTNTTNKDTSRSLVMQYRGVQGHRFYTDIIAFGKICLYIATLEPFRNGNNHCQTTVSTATVSGNNSENNTSDILPVTKNLLKKLKAINRNQADFIRICLNCRYDHYPSIINLLNHSILFEMPSLALICGHACADGNLRLNTEWEDDNKNVERVVAKFSSYIATLDADLNQYSTLHTFKEYKRNDFQSLDIDKYIEDIANGMHPITCFTKVYSDTYYSYLLDTVNSGKNTVPDDFPSSTGITNTTPTERTIDYSSQDDANPYYISKKFPESIPMVSSNIYDQTLAATGIATSDVCIDADSATRIKMNTPKNDVMGRKSHNDTTPEYTKDNYTSIPVDPPNTLLDRSANNFQKQTCPSNGKIFEENSNRLNCDEATRYDMAAQSSCSINFVDYIFIAKIKCHVQPIQKHQLEMQNNPQFSRHDSYLFLKIILADQSIMKFVFEFNRSFDSPSYFSHQVLKYHPFNNDDIAFMDQVILCASKYNAPIVCTRMDLPYFNEYSPPYSPNHQCEPPKIINDSAPSNTCHFPTDYNSTYFSGHRNGKNGNSNL